MNMKIIFPLEIQKVLVLVIEYERKTFDRFWFDLALDSVCVNSLDREKHVLALSDFISISINSPQISIFSSIDSSFRRLTVGGVFFLLLLLMTRSSFRIRVLFCLENRRR